MKKTIIYVTIVISLIVFTYYSFQPTKFVEKNCYEQYSENNNHVTRVYLVKSLPWSRKGFEKIIQNKLRTILRKDGFNSESIYFVREVNNNLVNRFFWGDNLRYDNCTTELNSAEFLAEVFYFKTSDNRDTMRMQIYQGDLYHY